MKHQTRFLSLLITLGLLFGFTALYWLTRTEVHTFDALSYTQDVENKPMGQLYHPHHLLYGPVGRLAVDLAESLGYSGRADAPIQALNALAGALGVVLLWQFGAMFSGRRWLALPIAILIGLTYAYWFYATEVEVYTLAAVFIILTMIMLHRIDQQPAARRGVGLGLALAGAVMFHQTNLMFAAPAGLFLLSDKRFWRVIPVFAVTLGAAVAIPYLMVAWHSNLHDINRFYDWLTGYAQSGNWGGFLSLAHRDALWLGLKNTISHVTGLAIGFYGLALIGLMMGGRWLPRRWWVFSLTWLILYGGFFWWWEPWNIEFWIALLPLWALWMLTGYLTAPLHPRSDRNTDAGERSIRQIIIPAGAAGLALLLLTAHWQPIRSAADADQDYYRQVTERLAPLLTDQDYVLTRGNILDLYLDFYADHPADQIWSLRQMRWSGADPVPDLLNRIDQAHRTGRIVYIDGLLLDQPADPQQNPFGFEAAVIEQIRAQFPIAVALADGDQIVFYSVGQRHAYTDAWTFDESLQGWTEYGAHQPFFADDSWCISGGADAWLESPPLALNADQIKTVHLMMTATAPGEGQIFWRGTGDSLSETQSLRFAVMRGRHVYQLDLQDKPGWSGEIVFIRFDFPSDPELSAESCLHFLEFEGE